MRYMSTEVAITRLRHDFEYEWRERLVTFPVEPSHEDIRRANRAGAYPGARSRDAISAETGTWAVEFRSQLNATDADLDRAREKGAG
jgi:hypothetical protein